MLGKTLLWKQKMIRDKRNINTVAGSEHDDSHILMKNVNPSV